MCRYAEKTYKSHYACFQCRKVFKQPDAYDILKRIRKEKIYHEPDGKSIRKVGALFTKAQCDQLDGLISEIESRIIKCPECSSTMADLGKDFKAPPKTAVKEWKIIESLFKIGKSFHSCGCDGIGYIPQNPKDYEIYLKAALHSYQESLASYQNRSIEECADKMEAVNYWSDKITNIKDEMIRQRLLPA